jgi:hypothetical protein
MWRGAYFRLAGVLIAFGLAGCMQTTPTPVAQSAPPKVAARPGVSPRNASIALIGVDGAPADTLQRFSEAFGGAAPARDITAVAPDRAAYLVRGYLTATPEAEGVRLTYVSDVFDRQKQRAQRVTSEIVAPARGADPWASADFAALNALAAQGAQDLAAVLSNTPEAAAPSPNPDVPTSSSGTTRITRASPAAASPRVGVADAH